MTGISLEGGARLLVILLVMAKSNALRFASNSPSAGSVWISLAICTIHSAALHSGRTSDVEGFMSLSVSIPRLNDIDVGD